MMGTILEILRDEEARKITSIQIVKKTYQSPLYHVKIRRAKMKDIGVADAYKAKILISFFEYFIDESTQDINKWSMQIDVKFLLSSLRKKMG